MRWIETHRRTETQHTAMARAAWLGAGFRTCSKGCKRPRLPTARGNAILPVAMAPTQPSFVEAAAYDGDVLTLPVADIDAAAQWYGTHFSMREVERTETPTRQVVLERDGVRLGFAENGGDSSQNGAAVRVRGIAKLYEQLGDAGVHAANWRVDERDGDKLQVFFVVAPDGLCYYFHQPISEIADAG